MYGQQPQPDSNMYTMQGFAQMQQGLIPNPQGTMPNSFVGQRFRGTVKSYSESNGYGFIGGDEITAALGKDVFVHQREVTEVTGIARPQIPAGVAVTFAVTINPKGQPQARELRFEDQSFLQLQAMGQPVSGQQPGGGGGGGGGGQMGQNGSFQYQYVQGGRRFRGFVRSFSQINGFGFVGSDEITQTFGKDAFLHFRELQTVMGQEKPTIPSGTWLTFTITINQKGQPQARDVQFEQFEQSASQPMGVLDQSSPAYAASAAVAALGFPQNPQMGLQQNQQTVPQGNNNPSAVYVSDAEAYARVQADIEKFQQEVAAQRAKTAAEALGGGDDAQQRQEKTEDEVDLRRAREKKMKEQGDFVSPSRSRSRSPRRREG